MTTSQRTPTLSKVLDETPIPAESLEYFRARLRRRFHSLVLNQFRAIQKKKKFSKADLARRLGQEPARISRLLGAPGNWTLGTVSDLLLAMSYEPILDAADLELGAISPTEEQWIKSEERTNTQIGVDSLPNMGPGESNVIELASVRKKMDTFSPVVQNREPIAGTA